MNLTLNPIVWLDKLAGRWIDLRQEWRARHIADPEVKEIKFYDGKLNATFISPIFGYMGEEAAKMLDSNPAVKSYLSFELLPRIDRDQGRNIIVTVQWKDGLSPAQKAANLQAELDVLKLDHADLAKFSNLRLQVIEHLIAGIANVNILDAAVDAAEILLRQADLNDLADDLRSGEAASILMLFGEDAGEQPAFSGNFILHPTDSEAEDEE